MKKSVFNLYRAQISPYQTPQFCRQERQLLEANFPIHCVDDPQGPVDILITSSATLVGQLPPTCLAQLSLVIHPNSGYDNYSLAVVKKITAPIVIGTQIRAAAVAGQILSCFWQHFAPLPFVREWDRSRQNQRPNPQSLRVLLLGFGTIGKLLAQSLGPLVQTLAIYDPYQGRPQMPSLMEFDAVILACSLNQQNYHWLDAHFFAQLSSRVVIINAARGGLVVWEDLHAFLCSHPQSFAYLDVFENGPTDLAQLAALPNVRCSSHVAGVFTALDQEVLAFEHQVLKDYFRAPTIGEFCQRYPGQILQQRIVNDLII